jgi:Zn-dependent metalloprotease
MNITTYNLNHATSGTGTVFTVTDNKWGDGKNYVAGSSTTAPNGVTAGVDAHYGVGETAEYYANVHMRNGIDGAGKATYNRVHYSNKYDNAFWSDTCFCMTYGDGSAFEPHLLG